VSPAEQLLRSELPLIIGHRGYAAKAPENTLPSFNLALESDADLIELDYQHSRDGVPMVFHDRFLDRTTDARKKWKRRRVKIAATTAAEIQSLDAGAWFDKKFSGAKVPSLAEALEFICGNGGVALIEHKSGDAKTLASLLRERRWINKVVVISFDWKFLRELHELEPQQILGALGPPARLSNGRRPVNIRRSLGSRLGDLLKTGAKLAVWNRRVSGRAVRSAREHQLGVWVYTVNQLKAARRLVKLGVNGIISDDPMLIAKVREQASI
jgi:glycerophosphoryl diester phosphodiesterase